MQNRFSYFTTVLALDKTKPLSMLKRGGIVEKSENLISPEDLA